MYTHTHTQTQTQTYTHTIMYTEPFDFSVVEMKRPFLVPVMLHTQVLLMFYTWCRGDCKQTCDKNRLSESWPQSVLIASQGWKYNTFCGRESFLSSQQCNGGDGEMESALGKQTKICIKYSLLHQWVLLVEIHEENYSVCSLLFPLIFWKLPSSSSCLSRFVAFLSFHCWFLCRDCWLKMHYFSDP